MKPRITSQRNSRLERLPYRAAREVREIGIITVPYRVHNECADKGILSRLSVAGDEPHPLPDESVHWHIRHDAIGLTISGNCLRPLPMRVYALAPW